MSSDRLFEIFYAVPNPHFNAFFESGSASSDPHPLADLAPAECPRETIAETVTTTAETPEQTK
jgi:hypothetical protein